MTKLLLEFCLNQSFSDRFLVGFGLLKAVLIAAFAWWFCGFSMRLWNRRFRMCLMHHCFCALSAIITIAALFLFNCVGAMDKFVSLAVNVWQAEYQNDATYRHETFVLIYHQLQAMYQQNGWTWDYSKYPQPTESPSIASQDHAETFSIPWNSAHSDATSMSVKLLCDRAIEHFHERQPILGRILWGNVHVGPEPLRRDIDNFFAAHPGQSYPFDTGPARVAGGLAVEKLHQEVGRYINRLRWELIGICILAQLLVFGLAGYSAASDVKIHGH
jgi:hypothetical protein